MTTRIAHPTEIPTREQWKTLLHTTQGPFVTLLMPSYRAGQDSQQNPVRFRNLLREAESRLDTMVEKGHKEEKGTIDKMREALRAVHEDHDFWQHQSEGLAVLAAPGLQKVIRLPIAVSEQANVSARTFLVRPITSLLDGDSHRFHVLALSQNAVRLLEATPWSVRELEIPGAPRSLQEALRYDDIQKHDHFYPGSQGKQRGGISPSPGHGLGVGDEKHQPNEEIVRFCQQVDAALAHVLKEPHVPLVLAGVDYLVAIYKEVSRHSKIAEASVLGNPEPLDLEELREKASIIAEPFFRQPTLEAAEQCRQLLGSTRASNRIEEILPAAHQGRVAVLFADPAAEVHGTFESAQSKVEIHHERRPEDEDMVNLVIVQAFLHGGSTHVLEPDGRPLGPGFGPLAAAFRY